MVMKKNIMAKNLRQSIIKSITRYIAIVLIIALGAAIFVGLRATKGDMVQTGQEFMDGQNMFDLRLLNTYGWSLENLNEIAAINGVHQAEGMFSVDVLGSWDDSKDEGVYAAYALPKSINKPYLLGGRMPEKPNEILVDGAHADDSILGTTFTLSAKNDEDTLDSFTCHSFTVVGYVSSPLFMDMSRGTTALGNGTVNGFIYIPWEAVDVDYYTEIDITIAGDYAIYTEEYNDAMDAMAEYIEPLLKPIALARYESVRQDAIFAYQDGWQEYYEGYYEFINARDEAMAELGDAEQQLLDGQKEIDENRVTLEDALVQINDGQKEIDENALVLIASREQLAAAKAQAYAQLAGANTQLITNRNQVVQNLALVESGLLQLDEGLLQLNDGISQLESGLQQMELMVTLMDTMLGVLDISIQASQSALDQAKQSGLMDAESLAEMEARLAELQQQKADYDAQYAELLENQITYSAQLEELYVTRDELHVQREELVANQVLLQDALTQIDNGFLELQSNQAMVDNEFAAAEAQIESGQLQLEMAQKELDANRIQVMDGLDALAEAQLELNDGWEDFRKGRDEAMREFAEAEAELISGRVQLEDARDTVNSLTEPSIFALGRNTNTSYLSLDSNSDIVEGVSAVFPVFFLLIAALVCITTMTRMVEEERTQIGTLKALGYSNFAIISKYLVYAGSAAVLGCGLGVFVGSAIFPLILWQAYNIILNIRPDITLLIDWPLCLGVVAMYTAVTMGVTWYSCRMALREVPAELIRPKAPTSGRKIFLEYLPFWNRISFLNKVMLRNIFRYRQRLLMMIIGIGGCAALLLTGFGIRDSIVDIVHYQFQEITLYDLEVRFSEDQDIKDQEAFLEDIGRYVENVTFAHQSSVELHYDGMSRDIIMIAAQSNLEDYMNLHRDGKPLSMPGKNEALLSVGIAQMLGVEVGDTVYARDADLRELELTVSGIYENYVYNYIIISPETMEDQWQEKPANLMAYIMASEKYDVHYVATKVMDGDGVMNVTVCMDLADQVGSMLEAMNLVVVTIVVCAGLLAITVLYNLTNINITERIREIATIKVLGFNAGESAAYVFKENLLLSGMGTVVGMFMGLALLEFVISKIQVEMVWLAPRLLPQSYVWSVVITMLMACVVDFVLYFKLEKINMAEALKSVE